MTAAPNQNLKTSKHLDNSGASCKSKLQTLQKLFNYLITVAKSQKFKTRGQAVALAAKQNNNSETAGLFCLQLQIKNSRQSLKIAPFLWLPWLQIQKKRKPTPPLDASKRPRTSKPWQTNPKINPCHLITLEKNFKPRSDTTIDWTHVPAALWHHWPMSRTPSSYGTIFGAGNPIRNRPP